MTRAGPYQHVSAGGMSLLAHGLFVAFLLFGVSWRSLPHLPVEAELWTALPEAPAAPAPAPMPLPEPLPAVAPPPEVAKPEVAKPDIALERAEKRRQEQRQEQETLRRQAEEKARVELAEKQRLEAQAQQEAERKLAERRLAERRLVEQELARQAQEELDAEAAQLRGALQKQQGKAGRQARLVGEFQDKIRGKILAYLRLPQSLSGNPEVMFKVTLLPNGEVVRAQLLRSSGQPAYDAEMERAILKASPLPLPQDREVAGVFRDGLILKFRPREEAASGR